MKAPHRIGQAFELKLSDAARGAGLLRPTRPADPAANYRDEEDADPGELAELAGSIASLGQLQRVGLYWTGRRYAVAFGFKRLAAMWKHREAYGFQKVKCERVDEATADVARLVENFDRRDPTSYETARYLFELHDGTRGRSYAIPELAEKTGKSRQTIENLIRFYRVLPPELREAWRRDRDAVFTFRRLAEFAMVAQESESEAVALLRRTLGDQPRTEARPSSGEEPGAVAPDEGGEEPAGGDARRFGRRLAARLARRLGRAGERLKTDDRAPLVHRLLLVAAGRAPVTEAEAIVQELLTDLGVKDGEA